MCIEASQKEDQGPCNTSFADAAGAWLSSPTPRLGIGFAQTQTIVVSAPRSRGRRPRRSSRTATLLSRSRNPSQERLRDCEPDRCACSAADKAQADGACRLLRVEHATAPATLSPHSECSKFRRSMCSLQVSRLAVGQRARGTRRRRARSASHGRRPLRQQRGVEERCSRCSRIARCAGASTLRTEYSKRTKSSTRLLSM